MIDTITRLPVVRCTKLLNGWMDERTDNRKKLVKKENVPKDIQWFL